MSRWQAIIADSNEARRERLATAVARVGCAVRRVADPRRLTLEARGCVLHLAVVGFAAHEERAALEAIVRLREIDRRLPVLVVADRGSEEVAVAALRVGAKDYFHEPLDLASFAASARRCLMAVESRQPDRAPAGETPRQAAAWLVGVSPKMRKISDYLARVAEHDATVLLTGETGTGKELAAARIHDLSRRRKARFVSVNCAAIPDGLLESELFGHESGAFTGAVGRRDGLMQAADSGTMFLDEIADMGVQGQAKILRALETREVYRLGGKRPERLDVRFVAATNQDLERAVEEGRFRKDLYYRLAVVRVHLPALRERRSDIGLLLDHYLEQLNPEPTSAATLAEDTRQMLQAYDWPGNVRELKNLVEALFVAAPTHPIALDDLPDAFRASLRRMAAAGGAERRRLMDALLAANWNKSRAAKMLHWSRMTVYRKMAKYSVILSTDARLRHGR
jgi:DNA-binding NtrC family response regulator